MPRWRRASPTIGRAGACAGPRSRNRSIWPRRWGQACSPDSAVLVDCLTLWLSNLLGAERDVAAECEGLLAALPGLARPVVFVSNEVGQGVVPDNALARAFVDHAGRLHQDLAAAAQRVVFMTAGLPQELKSVSETQSRVVRLQR